MVLTSGSVHIILYRWFPDINTGDLFTHGLLVNSQLFTIAWFYLSVGKLLSVTIQMKATEQYFPVMLFIMLYKVVLAF